MKQFVTLQQIVSVSVRWRKTPTLLLAICDIFQDIQSPLLTNEEFEDMFKVIMGFYIPNRDIMI